MGRKSSIDRLSAEVKTHIERRLAEGRMTLDELIDELRTTFPEEAAEGDLPSRSAVGRYGQKLSRRLAAIRASTEAAKIIQANAGDDKDARSGALTALIQTELFEAILDMQESNSEEVDSAERSAERVGVLSTAAKNIATLTRSSVDLKKFQAEVEAAARAKLLEEQKAKLDAMGSKAGVTEETKMLIRRELGIV